MRHGIVRYDLARGISALIVFAAHLSQAFLWPLLPAGSWLEIITGALARGAVLVFFVLSGLLVTGSIVGNVKRHGAFDPVDYLTSRAARIYPPFLFALFVTVGVVAVIRRFDLPGGFGALGQLRPGGLTFEPRELWHALLLYGGMTVINGPLWTLYIEVKLYLLAMGMALVVSGRSIAHRLIGTMVCVAALVLAQNDYGFWFFALIWWFGAALNVASVVKRRTVVVAVGVLTVAVAALQAPPSLDSWLDGTRVAMAFQATFCVLFALVYLLPGWAERQWPRWMLATAGYSYTLYVVHFPFLVLGYSLSLAIGFTSLAGTVASLLTTAAAALVVVMLVAPILEDDKFFKRALVQRRIG